MNVQLDRNQPRTPATDSRALQNLIKAEKTYVDELLSATSAAFGAASSLHAWGISETPDLDHASDIVAQYLEKAANAQKTYAQSLDQYRESLKDMLNREQSIRSIVRDRDILMSRVIKLTQRKPTKRELMKGEEEHQMRMLDAQRELQACEQTLANETAALIGVKRRTFKEALTMRAKVLGDTGAIMMDNAREILVFLDTFDADIPVAPMPVDPMDRSEHLYGAAPVQKRSSADQNIFLSDADTLYQIMPEARPQQQQVESVQQAGQLEHADYGVPSDEAALMMSPGLEGEPVYDVDPSPYDGVVPDDSLQPQLAQQPESFGTRLSPLPSKSSARRPQRSGSMASSVRSRDRPSRASRTGHRRASSSMSSQLPSMSLPSVPGGVPSAPRMNLEHARDGFVAPIVPGGVPSAPRLFAHHDDDMAASTVDSSVVQRPTRRRQADSDDEDQGFLRRGSTKHHYGGGGGGGGFFSRVSNLFRTDIRASPPRSHRRSGSESLLAPLSGSSRAPTRSSSRVFRDRGGDSSDEEPAGVMYQHFNERPALQLYSTQSGPRSPEEQALDEAIRQSVMGAGLGSSTRSRPASRQSDVVGGIKTGAPTKTATRPRKPRSNSVDLGNGATVQRVASTSSSTRKVKKRSSVDRVGATGTTASTTTTSPPGTATKGKKKRDATAFPPPAPSSFYNPGKYATDSWVPRADQLPARPASAQGLTSTRASTPLKSAMKSKESPSVRGRRISIAEADSNAPQVASSRSKLPPALSYMNMAAATTPTPTATTATTTTALGDADARSLPYISLSPTTTFTPMSLDLGRPVDGTGSLGMNLTDSDSPTKRSSMPTGLAPAMSYLSVKSSSQPPTLPRITMDDNMGSDATDLYRAWMASSEAQPTSSSTTASESAVAPADAVPSVSSKVEPAMTWASPTPSSAHTPSYMVKSPTMNTSSALPYGTQASSPALGRNASHIVTKSTSSGNGHGGAVSRLSQPMNIHNAGQHVPYGSQDDEEDSGPLRRRTSDWNTRIGRRDDSSDEEDSAAGLGGANDYYSARMAFGKSARHLGLATGTIQPKPPGEKRKKKAAA